jgi:hypothetical protein
MKKTILSLFLLCFVVFTVSAQVKTEKAKADVQKKSVQQSKPLQGQKTDEGVANADQTNPQADNPNAPVITFDKMVHDYGTITQNSDGNCEFKFTNDGKEPLILSNVRSS